MLDIYEVFLVGIGAVYSSASCISSHSIAMLINIRVSLLVCVSLFIKFVQKFETLNLQRDYGERRYDSNRHYRNDYRRRESASEEPEWFSAGPTSQTDTIELRGFEEPPSRESSSAEREHRARDDDRGQLHDRFRDDGDAEAAAAESQGLQVAMFKLRAGGSGEGVIR